MQPLQLSLKYIGPHKNTNIDFTIFTDYCDELKEIQTGQSF
jgi:hypothetical protein